MVERGKTIQKLPHKLWHPSPAETSEMVGDRGSKSSQICNFCLSFLEHKINKGQTIIYSKELLKSFHILHKSIPQNLGHFSRLEISIFYAGYENRFCTGSTYKLRQKSGNFAKRTGGKTWFSGGYSAGILLLLADKGRLDESRAVKCNFCSWLAIKERQYRVFHINVTIVE